MRLSFQIALLFLALYAFAIYLLMPMLLRQISKRVSLIRGAVSVAAISVVLFCPHGLFPLTIRRVEWMSSTGLHCRHSAIVNGLYSLDLILPPLYS